MRLNIPGVITAFGLISMLAFGNALAANELVMQKTASDMPILLASGSHNPCSHGHDKAHSKDHGKKHGHKNPCNPHGDAHNACNPCAANPCANAAANPCGADH